MWNPKTSKINPQRNLKIKQTKIQEVTQQIKNVFVVMLQDLNQIYIRNGINHETSSYLTSLIRLLAPLQLLPYFKSVQYQAKLEAAYAQQQQVMEKRLKQEINFVDNGYYPNYSVSRDDLKLIPKPFPTNQHGQDPRKLPSKSSKANKRYYYRDRTKPILKPQVEQQLVQWIYEKLSNEERVRRKDIAKKALELNNNQTGFGGSLGWVRRFLIRNPHVKQLLLAKSDPSARNSQYTLLSDRYEQSSSVQPCSTVKNEEQEKSQQNSMVQASN